MIGAARHFPAYQFVVAGAPSVQKEVYETFLKGTDVSIVYKQTYNLLSVSRAAVVTSGTATLETALLKVPQLVVYKAGKLTFFLGRMLVRYTFFSLVNLILDRELVREYLQYNLAEKIRTELDRILNDKVYRSHIDDGYNDLLNLMGKPGVPERLAVRMTELLNE